MEKHIYDEKNGLSYTLYGDYYLPDLALNEEEPIYGKYGMLRKQFLKEHRSAKYQYLLLTGKLTEHLNQIDQEARERVEMLMEQMAEKQGVTEATDDEVIRRGKELSCEGRTWKQIVWEEIIVPISQEAMEQLLRIGYQHFEVWMEEKAVPVAKEKSKMLVQNAGNIFSGVKAALRGEEPKALRLIKEAQEFQKKQLVAECDLVPEKEVEEDNHEKILMSAQEIEDVVVQAKQSAEILVVCINLLRNTAVSDTVLTEEQKLNLQSQLESLTTKSIFEKIDLLLEDKNKGILEPMSLQILKAFRQDKFLINGKEVPIRNYIE